jgi:hypothetical protein
MANIENGNNTAGLANVDADYNLQTTTPQATTRAGGDTAQPNYVGAVRIVTENDGGALTGDVILGLPSTSLDDRLQVGITTPLFNYTFNATAQDTTAWTHTFTTMTMTQSGGFLNCNAGNIGTAATGCLLSSKRYVALTPAGGLRFAAVVNISLAAAANQIWYVGIGVPVAAVTPPTDGVWFQYSTAGLIGVVSYNGVTTTTGALPTVSPLTIPVNTNVTLQVKLWGRSIYFYYNSFVVGVLPVPVGNAVPFMSEALPAFIQQVNTGTVAGGTFMQLKVASVIVDQTDLNWSKPYAHVQSGKGLSAYQGTPGNTQGSTALFTNSLAAGAGAAMTNTTAALGTGLGGQFTYLPTLAANTDGILCSFQNPAGSVNVTARTLHILGVRIQSIVSTVLVGGPCYMVYSLAFGHTALSLATAETGSFVTASAKAPRRIALGLETFPATAALGTTTATGTPVVVKFDSPVVVNPGEFIAICAKNLAGTVTSSGTITALVTFDGYFE